MVTTRDLRTLLSDGSPRKLAEQLVPLVQQERITLCRPLVKQANAVLSGSSGSTVRSWLKHLRADYPGGHEQFVDAWNGRLSDRHWDAATTVLVASKAPAQAARVWPIPGDAQFAEWLYPALFPGDMRVFTEQWSADFVANPKHWDRNRGRTVMYEWVEDGVVEAPKHDGAVLMMLDWCGVGTKGGLLGWLVRHPVVTDQIFRRIFTTPGVKGASLAQSDSGDSSEPTRTKVIPGLISKGVWTHEFVEDGVRIALASDLPPYQMRWFKRLAADLAL